VSKSGKSVHFHIQNHTDLNWGKNLFAVKGKSLVKN